jgi:Mn-dependent DtxR family transcriptional regulator
MTEQEETALAFIQFHIDGFGFPPSVGDVAQELGVGRSRTHGILRKLVEDGHLQVEDGLARTWRPTQMKAPEVPM